MTQKEHDEKVNKLRTQLAEAEKQIQDIRKELDELDKVEIEPESRRWKPNRGQIYYLISDTGTVTYTPWYNSNVDLLRFAIGNIFQTKEEAKFEIERLKVIAELNEFAEHEDTEWDGGTYHFYIYWNLDSDSVEVTFVTCIQSTQIYFKSVKVAEEAIKAVGEDRIKKYYLRVKE